MRTLFKYKKIVAFTELIIASIIIFLDIFIPTLVILAIAAVSLFLRKESTTLFGFKKNPKFFKMVFEIFLLSIGWSLFHLSVTMPLLNHLTGMNQNLSMFADLKGNGEKLIIFIVFSWTLSALGEEIAYRGYLQKVIVSLFKSRSVGIVFAVVCSSLLFGIAHTEQGVVGIILTFMDALFFSWLKLRFNNNLWAAVVAHGFNNTLGLVTFYLIGPLYGFW